VSRQSDTKVGAQGVEALRSTIHKRDQEIKELKVELAAVRQAYREDITARRIEREESNDSDGNDSYPCANCVIWAFGVPYA
jgi:hypothetical protein